MADVTDFEVNLRSTSYPWLVGGLAWLVGGLAVLVVDCCLTSCLSDLDPAILTA